MVQTLDLWTGQTVQAFPILLQFLYPQSDHQILLNFLRGVYNDLH